MQKRVHLHYCHASRIVESSNERIARMNLFSWRLMRNTFSGAIVKLALSKCNVIEGNELKSSGKIWQSCYEEGQFVFFKRIFMKIVFNSMWSFQ